ncbi:MAG: type II toxin-antitoxin system RelE/ParE family toxin [Planctomycetota bacterium]
MTDYRIFETDEFRRNVRELDARQQSFVETKLSRYVYPQLRHQPYLGTNIKKLQGYQPETWRYRIGRFRVFYGIDEPNRIVNILTVDHRKDAYRGR